MVAWKSVCMPWEKGGLGLFYLKACNRSFLAKQLWNIHLKTDSVWIRWVHHFYLSNGSIWTVSTHHTSSPLWKSIHSVRDLITQHCGSHAGSIALLRNWSNVKGSYCKLIISFGWPTLQFHGKELFGNNGLCQSIALFYGWLF